MRNYRQKNRFQRWSKLKEEQTAYLFRTFFHPFSSIRSIAAHADISVRSVYATYAAINSFILAHPACLTALIERLEPETVPLRYFAGLADLTPTSPIWEALRFCFFSCPAEHTLSLQLQDIERLPAVRFLDIMSVKKGMVTMVRVQCAACTAAAIRTNVDSEMLFGVKTYLTMARKTSKRAIHRHFIQYALTFAILLRADAQRARGESAEEKQKLMMDEHNAYSRDLATILAHYVQGSRR